MAHRPIPMVDVAAEIDALWEPVNQAIGRVLRSGQFILGPDVQELETELGRRLGVNHAIGCNSGTDGRWSSGCVPWVSDRVMRSSPRPLRLWRQPRPSPPLALPRFLWTSNRGPLTLIRRPLAGDRRTHQGHHPRASFRPSGRHGYMQAIAQNHNLKVLEDTAQRRSVKHYAAGRPAPWARLEPGRSIRPRTWGPAATPA